MVKGLVSFAFVVPLCSVGYTEAVVFIVDLRSEIVVNSTLVTVIPKARDAVPLAEC